jgi:hypothetical protein
MTTTREVEAGDWWADRRLRYNIALLIAGAVAFVAYLAALAIGCHDDPEVDVTIFTTCFQAVGYFIAIGIANIFYTFGYLLERLLRPRAPERYRRIAYRAGFTFSVALPFSIPALILLFGCAGGGRA